MNEKLSAFIRKKLRARQEFYKVLEAWAKSEQEEEENYVSE